MRTSPILCLLLPLLFACGKPAQEKPRGGPPPAQITVTQVIPGEDVQAWCLSSACKHVMHQITRGSVRVRHPGQCALFAHQMLHYTFVAK